MITDKSVSDQIEAIIHHLNQGSVTEDPFVRTLERTASHPNAASEFADSKLTTADGSEWLWGNSGIVYGFWRDNCKTSALLW